MSLEVKAYTRIKTGASELGVIAQQAAVVDPLYTSEYYNHEDDTKYMTVDYARIHTELIAAVQAQQATIEALTARIETLEG
jgi:hypothetical protein